MTHQRDSIEFSIFLEGGVFHFFKSLTCISPKCWKMVILTEVLTCVMEIKTTTVLTVLMYLWNSFLESNDVMIYRTLFFVTYMATYLYDNRLVLDMFFTLHNKSLKPFACLKLTLKGYKQKYEIILACWSWYFL